MGKIWVEVCLVSARGLRRTSALWKLQWFGVGWINPDNKYCTRIDSSGNANPVWKTKFSALIDTSDPSDLALHVEVYSRDPIFLRERLQGTATVVLKEFLDKFSKNSEPVEEVGSFQLRRRNSNKPQGFVDVSIRISEEKEEPSSYRPGDEEGLKLRDHNSGINLVREPDPVPFSNSAVAGPSRHQSPLSYTTCVGGHGYPPPPTPPPSNVGYIPTSLPPSYINMPCSSGSGPSNGAGFGLGLGAGALAAGAAIFGDNFMSGFHLPKDAALKKNPF